MATIAIAGGSGNVGREVIDALVATKKHVILVLSRKDPPAEAATSGVLWAKADYEDVEQLAEVLRGVHTVLSFVTVQTDHGNVAQKNLIDAAVQAGVKRFAPSEWATSSLAHLDWYAGKEEIREYLKKLNKDKKSTKHIKPFETQIDFNKRRTLMIEGGEDDLVTLTTVQDLVNVVTRAVEYEGEWPVVGGIKGEDVSVAQLIALGEKIRGGPFDIERLKADDLRAGVVKASWMPRVDHPALEQVDGLSQSLLAGMLLGISAGVLNVSDEWNRLLPDYVFTPAEKFLTEAWRHKP